MDLHIYTQFTSSKTKNPLLTFLLSYHVRVTSKIQVNFRFERYWWYGLINCWNFPNIYVFYVMSRHVTSCHVKSRHVMSCHAMPSHATSCTSCHVMSRHVTSCHVTSCHVTSCHVMPRHVTSWHVMSRRKSRDGHTTNASLSADFFHTQLIQIRHNHVRWLSRRLPIPYRISGIWSSFTYVQTHGDPILVK